MSYIKYSLLYKHEVVVYLHCVGSWQSINQSIKLFYSAPKSWPESWPT